MGGSRSLVLTPAKKSPLGLPSSLFNADAAFFDGEVTLLTDELVFQNKRLEEQLLGGTHSLDAPPHSRHFDRPSSGESELNRDEFVGETENEGSQTKEDGSQDVSRKYSCHSCGIGFDSVHDQRIHFKTDWHRFNVKRKISNKKALSEAEFDSKVDKEAHKSRSSSKTDGSQSQEIFSDESDLSSISGSDESDEEEQRPSQQSQIRYDAVHENSFSLNRSPKVWIYLKSKNLVVSVWRVLINGKSSDTGDVLLQNLKNLTRIKGTKSSEQVVSKGEKPDTKKSQGINSPVWILLLSSGGHFAGIVVDYSTGTVIDHHTFHRYVVRAKAGGRQSTKDSRSKNAPKSAGSSLRRYNEFALQKEIKELIVSWKQHFSVASFIFLHSPSENFFQEEDRSFPLKKNDARLKKIPFPIQRPTFKEACRVAQNLASLDYPSGIFDSSESRNGRDEKVSIQSIDSLDKPPKVLEQAKRDPEGVGLSSDQTKSISYFPKSGPGKKHDLELENKLELLFLKSMENKHIQVTDGAEKEHLVENKEKEEEASKGVIGCVDKDEEEKPGIMKGEEKWRIENEGKMDEVRQTEGDETFNESEIHEGKGIAEMGNEVNGNKVSNIYELHVASSSGDVERVQELLERGNHDPSLKDEKGRSAYSVAANKEIKNVFRRFMTQFPSQWDWKSAGVFLPLNEDIEKEELQKKAEKDARRKAKEKEKKAKKKELLRLQKEKEETEKKLNASKEEPTEIEIEREKRARAAEKRLQSSNTTLNSSPNNRSIGDASLHASPSKCETCGASLQGKTPFYRLSYQYCSTACVRAHMTALERS